jgi:hypothetical protein
MQKLDEKRAQLKEVHLIHTVKWEYLAYDLF